MTTSVQIPPNFDGIPTQLKQIPNWVCWRVEEGRKVPYQAANPTRRASSTNPSTWSTFEVARLAYESSTFDGVGIVLDGSGLVGVDLDHCVVDGIPSDAALKILDEIGCDYVESSPSGTGLRGFGFGVLYRAIKKNVDGVNVELYQKARYLTVTGSTYRHGSITELTGLTQFLNRISSPTEETEDTEEPESISSVSSVSSVGLEELPQVCFPRKVGQRHSCIFQIARYLKGRLPESKPRDHLKLLKAWHVKVLDVIGTKEWEISLAEFITAWDRVRYPANDEIINEALSRLPAAPQSMDSLGYGEKGKQLMQICLALQKCGSDGVLFLSCRKAAQLLEIHYSDANKIFNLLVSDGYLTVIQKGIGMKATRYRIDRSN